MPTQAQENQAVYNRKFGIELEFATLPERMSDVAAKMQAAGLNFRNLGGYGHSDGSAWDLKTDSSAGLEISSRVLRATEEGIAEVYNFVKTLDKIRENSPTWKVTTKCGFHIHVDITDLTFMQTRNLVKLVLAFESVIFGMNPDCRQNNNYCRRITGIREYEEIAGMRGFLTREKFLRLANSIRQNYGKYYGLNMLSAIQGGQVEFRYMAGTLNPEKVRAWVLFILSLVEKAKNSDFCAPFIQTPKPFKQIHGQAMKCLRELKKIGIRTGVSRAKATLTRRFKKFSGNRAETSIHYNLAT